MKNLSFQGYAQRKGFNPEKVPDETFKIRQETERQLQGMRAVRDQNRQNRSEQLEALKTNAYKEQQQRNQNFDLLNNFKKAFHDAEMQHYEIDIQDAKTKEIEARRGADRFNKLKDLAPKAFNSFINLQNQRLENALGKATETTANFMAAMPDAIKAQEVINQSLLDGRDPKQALLHTYTDPATQLYINQNFRGLKGLAIQAKILSDYGKYGFVEELKKQQATLKVDGTYTYNQLAADPNDTDGAKLNAALSNIYSQTVRKLGKGEGNAGYSPYIINKYFAPHADAIIAQERQAVSDLVVNNTKRINAEEDSRTFNHSMRHQNGSFVADNIKEFLELGNNRSIQKATAHHELKKQFESGELTEADKDSLFNVEVDFNGKKMFLGVLWEPEFVEYNKIITTRETKLRELREKENKNISSKHYQSLKETERSTGQRANSTTFQEIYRDMTMEGMSDYEIKKYAPWFKDMQNREPISLDNSRTIADGLYNDGLLSVDALINGIDPRLWAEYLPKTNDAYGITKEHIDNRASKLKKAIADATGQLIKDPSARSTTVDQMYDIAKRKFFPKALETIAAGDIKGAENALDYALNEEIKLIKAREGIYALREDANGAPLYGDKAGFKYFDDLKKDPELIRIEDGMLSDQNSAQKPGFFGSDEEAVLAWGRGEGPMPTSLSVAFKASKYKSHKDIVNDVLISRGEKPLEYVGLEQAQTWVNGRHLSDINNAPSFFKYINSVTVSAFENDDYTDLTKRLTDTVIPKDIYNFHPDNPSDVAKNAEGLFVFTEEFGRPLEEFTLSDVKTLFGTNQLVNVGPFDFDMETLEREEAKGNIDEDTFLTPDLMRYLKMQNIYDESSKWYIPGMKEAIPGFGKQHAKPLKGVRRTIKTKEERELSIQNNLQSISKSIDSYLESEVEREAFKTQQVQSFIDRVRSAVKKGINEGTPGTGKRRKQLEQKMLENELSKTSAGYVFAEYGIEFGRLTDDTKETILLGF